MRTLHVSVLSALVALVTLVACGDAVVAPPPLAPTPVQPRAPTSTSIAEPVPTLRLPKDTRPTAETLVLSIDPAEDRFSGTATIDVTLDHARSVVWIHGRDLHVSRATVTPDGAPTIAATWEQRADDGTSSLTLARAAPAGNARVTIDYDAPFAAGLVGLFKVKQAGVPYAFTQLESIDARRAFPCFDEPGFKIPFSVSLVVPSDAQAIANTREIARSASGDGKTRVIFATTKPLPSYLLAFGVGPFDVVNAPDVPPNEFRKTPLPLRAIAAKGRGKELAYTVAHTGEILSTLEKYFGIAYPYDKLDMIAVPDQTNAMENPGAIMCAEQELLLDDASSLDAKQESAATVAHELAHQWFGDLVTMEWWDDVWLNESLANWMEYKAAHSWNPSLHMPMLFADEVQRAMNADSLVNARQIRQPIVTHGDIDSAFDSITYGKGSGVLAMYEQWMGADVFQRGVRAYLGAHANGSATADDFLSALSTAAGHDVTASFHTFLDQPGVPFVEAKVACDGGKPRLHLKQSRFLPAGTTGDAAKTWQLPVCVRYGANGKSTVACTLLAGAEGDLPLEACPDWVMPNAGGVGYYRFALGGDDLKKLRDKGLVHLEPRERVAYGNALRAAFQRVTAPFGELIDAASPLVSDAEPGVAAEALYLPGQAREWLYGDPLRAKIEAYDRRLVGGAFARLGFDAKKGEDSARTQRRQALLAFLLFDANDPGVRATAKKHGLRYLGTDDRMHPEAIETNIADVSLMVVGQEADAKTWGAMRAKLAATNDDASRARILHALASARDPTLSAQARDLVLSDVLRESERIEPLYTQMRDPATRDAVWTWLKANFDPLATHMKMMSFGTPILFGIFGRYCDKPHADEIEAFLAPRLDGFDGGARAGAAAVEKIRLCAARREAEEPGARAYFAGAK